MHENTNYTILRLFSLEYTLQTVKKTKENSLKKKCRRKMFNEIFIDIHSNCNM